MVDAFAFNTPHEASKRTPEGHLLGVHYTEHAFAQWRSAAKMLAKDTETP